MRPLPARILFSLLAAAALTLGVLIAQPTLFVVAALALFLLTTSLATSRLPVTRALGRFRGHAVQVRLWGGPPPDSGSATFLLTSVNVISVGAHVFFDASDGLSRHLKVAQPRGATFTPEEVIIPDARYVQWNRTRVQRRAGAAAVVVSLVSVPDAEV